MNYFRLAAKALLVVLFSTGMMLAISAMLVDAYKDGYSNGLSVGRQQARSSFIKCASKDDPAICFDRMYMWSADAFYTFYKDVSQKANIR